jgi:hypothetical protein
LHSIRKEGAFQYCEEEPVGGSANDDLSVSCQATSRGLLLRFEGGEDFCLPFQIQNPRFTLQNSFHHQFTKSFEHFTMTVQSESIIKASNNLALNWVTTDINAERSLGPVDWKALQEYAINVKRKHTRNHDVQTACQLSSEYNIGGLNLVRRLDFQDGTSWVARI